MQTEMAFLKSLLKNWNQCECPLRREWHSSAQARPVMSRRWLAPLGTLNFLRLSLGCQPLQVVSPLSGTLFFLLNWQSPAHPAGVRLMFPLLTTTQLGQHSFWELPQLLASPSLSRLPLSAPSEQEQRFSFSPVFPQCLAPSLPYGWCSLNEWCPDSQACVSKVLSITWK